MSAVLDLWHSVMGIATGGDWVALAIMVVIALAIGFTMQTYGSIVTATVGALALFAVAIYVRGMVSMKNASAGALADTDWHSLLGLTVHTVLAYAIAFAIVISAVHVVRSLVSR